jgi:hypothetical protein
VPPFATLPQTAFPTVQPPHVAPPFPQDEGVWLAYGSHVVLLLQQPLQPLLVLQTQVPPEHVVPFRHGWLQLPQLLLSSRLLHVVPQSVWLAAQPFMQPNVVPDAEQLGAEAGQTFPHAPQFWALERSTVHPADPFPEQYVQPA